MAIQFTVNSDLASSLAGPVGYGISLADAVEWTPAEKAAIASTSITGRGSVVMMTEQFVQRSQSFRTTLAPANPLTNPGGNSGHHVLPNWDRNMSHSSVTAYVGVEATSVPDGGSTLLLLGSVLLFGSGLAIWQDFRPRFLSAV